MTDSNELKKVIAFQKAKIEDLERILSRRHDYFKCSYCGEMRREDEVAEGYDDLCDSCLEASERRAAGCCEGCDYILTLKEPTIWKQTYQPQSTLTTRK